MHELIEPTILLIETATDRCSVALVRGIDVLAVSHAEQSRQHASQLTVLIDGLLKKHGGPTILNAVAVSEGPGSYTGLRIGTSTAKGMCFALEIPLVAVDTTLAMASAYIQSESIGVAGTCYLPVIDARRMEVYGAVYNAQLTIVDSLRAEVLHARSFMDNIQGKLVVFGDAAEKCREVYFDNPQVQIDTSFEMTALGLHRPALERFRAGQFEDLVTFEPRYLKEFITKSKGGVVVGSGL